jgi:predicted AlkP superfamily phosphohydrolase/phosphomutase
VSLNDSLIEELVSQAPRDAMKPGRAVVLGIDGVPFSMLKDLFSRGIMPNFARLAGEGTLHRMESTLPCVSSVAWTSFRTGMNPGSHGITGFTDRKPGTYKTYFPTTSDILCACMEEVVDSSGGNAMVMGMPVNYPPVKLSKGISIGCFLSPSLEKAVHPRELLADLKEINYRLDVTPALARTDPPAFFRELFEVTDGYRSAMFRFWKQRDWRLMMIHFMTTDRMHHFMWDQYTDRSAPGHQDFFRLYARIDEIIGEIAERLDEDTMLVMLSDHGFCGAKLEVNLNAWLQQQGLLRFQTRSPRSLEEIDGRSQAYSLIPGRFYVNLKGREPRGSVDPGREYELVRERIREELLRLCDPNTGEPIIERVEMRESVYGDDACSVAPDMVALARYGYDLKDKVGGPDVFRPATLKGNHTYDDAFFFVNRPLSIPAGLKIFEASEIVGRQCRCRNPRR